MSEVTVRPPRDEDVAAIVDLYNAHSQALHGADTTSEADLRLFFDSPHVDPTNDVFLAVDGAGRLLAYADVADWGLNRTSLWVDVRRHPDRSHAEAEAAVLRAAEERAGEWADEAPPGACVRLAGVAAAVDEDTKRLFGQAGYRPVRHSFRMEIGLPEGPRAGDWPPGISVRRFGEGQNAREIMDVQNEVFRDSWRYVPETYDEWSHFWFSREGFDPNLWFIAEADGEIAGIALCRPHAAEVDLGWVEILGVRRPWRRRGLGHALLLESFGEFRRRGIARVGLGVDAESPTGATRLYERAGMRVVRGTDIYERELRPGE